ncbi:MAG: asparagine--tRNA ligase [Planctomycetaceae bacterium]
MSSSRMIVSHVLKQGEPGAEVTVAGWVRTRRDSKHGFSFVELNDGSCMSNLQIVVDATVPGYADVIKRVTTGASVRITGLLKESPGAKQRVELQASTLELLGVADPETYPLQKKGHSMEFLREIAHLRPRTNTFGAVARVRNCITWSIHRFFQERGFLNVHTPIITTSDCEGAGEMFTVSTLLHEAEPVDGKPKSPTTPLDFSKDFFGKRASLTVSGQLEAETYATAVGPVYTFGPTFRAENSNTPRHLAEFWMIEPEVPFFELNDDMQLAEDFVKTMIRDCLEQCPEDMDFFNQRIDTTLRDTLDNILNHEFKRITYTEAVEILLGVDRKWEYQVEWGTNLQAEHERYLTEEHFKQPIIVYDYPRTLKPFYMYCNDDGKTVRAMDVLVPRVGEIIGGSQREHRLEMLETRFAECGLPQEDYWWYLDLRRFGTVPHAGFGLGLERAVLLITGLQNIRDTLPYPRTPRNAEF